MATPLLTTKLYIPPIRQELVPRPRLVERLNAGLQRKLTLISAPAGFGKTTLLSTWLADLGTCFAWLSLDEGDNDFARFFSYLIAALQGVEPQIGADLLSTLQSLQPSAAASASQPGAEGMEELLTTLLNQVNTVSDDFVLVLDDYHLIEARPVHDALAFLLAHLPRQMHLVIATRADPPLPLALLRGRGQLNELRQTDLRFTPDEVAQFLAQVAGMTLPSDDVAALVARTEGWVAGLQMAAISMRGREAAELTDFVRSFTGSNRYVLDYLIEEVLRRQPQEIQAFLLRTSILDRLTGPLCDALLQIDGSDAPLPPLTDTAGQETLEGLERANLFIVSLDDRREWYRYHHLFVELLRQRLHRVAPALVSSLHRQASDWYEQHANFTAPTLGDEKLIQATITHALAAEDFERAALLTERAIEATWRRGEFKTLLGWIEALPDQIVRSRPFLCIYHALIALLSGYPLDRVTTRLQDAVQSDEAGQFSGETAMLRATLAALQGDVQRGIEYSHRALEQLPNDKLFLRGLVTRNLGVVHKVTGDLEAAIQAFEKGREIAQQADDWIGTLVSFYLLAETHMIQGRLCVAKEFCQRALDQVADRRGGRLHVAGRVLIVLGELWRQWDDLETAARYFHEGIELLSHWAPIRGMGGYLGLAYVRQAQGDPEGARESIREAERLAAEFDLTQMDDIAVAAHRARLWILQGDIQAAARWAETRGLTNTEEREQTRSSLSYHIDEIEQITLARLYLAQDRPAEALRVLAPLQHCAERLSRVSSLIEISILQALAFEAQDELDRALQALEHALTLAEPEGFVRLFVDGGPPMARLLYEAAARDITPGYAGRLLAAFPFAEAVAQTAAKTAKMIEPLSERELEVLRLIAQGLSNQEIAQRLFISLNTVKWHTSNIYGKLEVKKRTQAVAQARELGILPSLP